ncbi:MAG: bifunctional FO biosynthesis protein CofGH [Candidatus Nanopelagicales bacterium]
MGRPSSEHAFRRALARARRGQTIDAAEAAALASATGNSLDELLDLAGEFRDRGRAAAGLPGVITYSPKVFIPVTRLCRDRCHYCTFATVPHRLPAPYLSPEEILEIARHGAALGCAEALFTLGDRPEERWPAARAWLEEAGYPDTLSYVRAMAIRVLEETGLLPHLNPGVMSWEEMRRLRPVAPSMGMMLETTAKRLWSEPGGPHFGSPDKEPRVRLQVLEDAGRLRIPFTSGILVGIGENVDERVDALMALRATHRRHRHLQEVIVQNFRAKDDTAMRGEPDLDRESYLATLATARILLGPAVRIQAPPNLSEPDDLAELLRAGVDDWGGVSPLTPDHVNPERPWPHVDDLARATATAGFTLRPRLTVHPEYVAAADWIDPRVRDHVDALAGTDGLLGQPCHPEGRPWQEPGTDGDAYAQFARRQAGGRVDLHLDIDRSGRRTDTRSDIADVYGDWAEVGERAREVRALERLDRDVRAALDLAEQNPSSLADPAHRDAAIALMSADGDALAALAALADAVRKDVVGDEVTYVVNRNINFTNVCYTGCRFCAFAQRERDADAFTLTADQIGERVHEAVAAGATEICMQGGIHPDLPGRAYFDLARAVKDAEPTVHLHAFSPMEVVNGATRANMSIREWLEHAKSAGLDSIPGTAAEILDDEVRWILTKGKLSAQDWVDAVRTAHQVGLPSTATMMFGHVDAPHHWVDHLRVIRSVQEDTGGFTEFVPLPFVHHQSPIYLAGVARPGPTFRDILAVHAMARLMLHGAIDHVQCSWVKVGDEGCRALLRAGADDIGGTLMEETISRMAGSGHGSARSVSNLQALVRSAGRVPRQRGTTYETPVFAAQA